MPLYISRHVSCDVRILISSTIDGVLSAILIYYVLQTLPVPLIVNALIFRERRMKEQFSNSVVQTGLKELLSVNKCVRRIVWFLFYIMWLVLRGNNDNVTINNSHIGFSLSTYERDMHGCYDYTVADNARLLCSTLCVIPIKVRC